MQNNIKINKTWNDRMTGNVINHFFENIQTGRYGELVKYMDYLVFNEDGTVSPDSISEYAFEEHRWVLTSGKGLDVLDSLNSDFWNNPNNIIPDSIAQNLTEQVDVPIKNFISSVFSDAYRTDSDNSKHTKQYDFQQYINVHYDIENEKTFWQTFEIHPENLNLTTDPVNNIFNVKYTKPISLLEKDNPFNHQQFLNDGNQDLYLVIPYRNPDGYHGVQTVYNPEFDEVRYQISYIALKITDLNGDGDIKFDHIDSIDYFDSLEFTLKTPGII